MTKDRPGRNNPCLCGSGRKYKHCHGGAQGPPEYIRVTFHLDPEGHHDVLVLTGPTREVTRAGQLEGNMLEAFLELDEDAFGSGAVAEDLLGPEGRQRFLKFLEGMGKDPEVRVNVASRNREMGFAVPISAIRDIAVARWRDVR